MTQLINKQVLVTALGFRRNVVAYPKRMEYGGTSYTFIDAGVSCRVGSGDRMTQIMTMTDGHTEFRLRSDNKGGTWTLLNMMSA